MDKKSAQRKGKKSWRKNVDVSQIVKGMEQQEAQIRLGGYFYAYLENYCQKKRILNCLILTL